MFKLCTEKGHHGFRAYIYKYSGGTMVENNADYPTKLAALAALLCQDLPKYNGRGQWIPDWFGR